MDKKTALKAIRVIDSVVSVSARKRLSKREIVELRSACETLVSSVKRNAFATARVAWMVTAIEEALAQENDRLHRASRDFFLDYLIPLTLYIESQPGSVQDPASTPPLL